MPVLTAVEIEKYRKDGFVAVEGRIVRGAATGRVRLEPMEFELQEIYTESSFFAVQTRRDE